VALGAVSRARRIPGLAEHEIGFKMVSEAIARRNQRSPARSALPSASWRSSLRNVTRETQSASCSNAVSGRRST
jgi:NADH dehydrogenase FAD-containing subunit